MSFTRQETIDGTLMLLYRNLKAELERRGEDTKNVHNPLAPDLDLSSRNLSFAQVKDALESMVGITEQPAGYSDEFKNYIISTAHVSLPRNNQLINFADAMSHQDHNWYKSHDPLLGFVFVLEPHPEPLGRQITREDYKEKFGNIGFAGKILEYDPESDRFVRNKPLIALDENGDNCIEVPQEIVSLTRVVSPFNVSDIVLAEQLFELRKLVRDGRDFYGVGGPEDSFRRQHSGYKTRRE